MKSVSKTQHSIHRSLNSAGSGQRYGNLQGQTSFVGSEQWQHELAKARKKFKRFSNGRCLSQELIEERARER
jgi:hypothetical protein